MTHERKVYGIQQHKFFFKKSIFYVWFKRNETILNKSLTSDPSVPDRNQGGLQSGSLWSLHGDAFLLQPPPEENPVSFYLHQLIPIIDLFHTSLYYFFLEPLKDTTPAMPV